MHKLFVRALGVVGLAAALAVASGVSAADPAASMRVIDASAYKWQPFAEGTPLTFVPLWGDRASGGEYAMLLKLPAGFSAGMHSHSADYHALAVQGQWVHTDAAGRPAQPLSQGSYVFQPGAAVHNDVCKGPQDCILFIKQSSKLDFLPAKK